MTGRQFRQRSSTRQADSSGTGQVQDDRQTVRAQVKNKMTGRQFGHRSRIRWHASGTGQEQDDTQTVRALVRNNRTRHRTMCVCESACMCVRACACVLMRVGACVYLCVPVYICVCVSACVLCARVCACVSACVCAYICALSLVSKDTILRFINTLVIYYYSGRRRRPERWPTHGDTNGHQAVGSKTKRALHLLLLTNPIYSLTLPAWPEAKSCSGDYT